ncbi:MAG TPA: ABC-F family ATP-binding cassette domain-containing protein [Streptosporangiaceae bacterium]
MNLLNLENVDKAYGPSPLLDAVSLGVDDGERIGVVGRNGGGKSTLVSILAGRTEPDSGRVTHARGLRVGYLGQHDALDPSATVRATVLGDVPEHTWAGDARVRDILRGLLGLGATASTGLDDRIDLDATIAGMSGGERRRVALAAVLVAEHDLIIADEPTNHLDIEAIDWLARHFAARPSALVVVTHDRWFLDAVTNRTWEVADGQVQRYDGGYAAYVLAKAERQRLAAATEERRQNLMRKELAWLRRGPPARSTKPKFRIDAANALIADEPPARDTVELTRFASARLGKDVLDVEDVTYAVPGRTLFDHVTWRLGPGERAGLVGVNGSGKSTLLRLLDATAVPGSGKVKRGKTVRMAHLSQELAELDPARRVLESVEEIRKYITVGKKEWTAGQLLERLGFTGDRQWTPIGELSGGERRRLQILRLLMDEPNVLLLDEPTNDLDIETLTELEDILDGWPGTLVVVSHDRYFLERISDHIVALLGDGVVSALPGGVDEYLRRREESRTQEPRTPPAAPAGDSGAQGGGGAWAARKELARIERRIERLDERAARLHERLAEHATDYAKLVELNTELKNVQSEKDDLEETWLELAESQ